ncbi:MULTISPECIES: dienelactone hydrolase family protein [unclassified Gordonia (in: high G+C Gram-positive bacteria)]
MASFGSRDVFVPQGERRLNRKLDKYGIEHDTKTYPGIGHSFANHLDDQVPPALVRIVGMSYDAEASADAWLRVFAFLAARFAETVR